MKKKENVLLSPDIELDDWQKQVLECEGDVILATGRQVGKTVIFSRKAVERCVKKKSTIIMCSLTEEQAFNILAYCLNYAERYYKSMIGKGRKKPTKNKLHFVNGSIIIVRPVGSTGDAIRSFTGSVLYVDEASRMPKSVWLAGKPTLLTTAGDIWMSSTHYGTGTYFHECTLNKNNRYTVFEQSSEDVIKNRPISKVWTEEVRRKAIEFLEEEKLEMSAREYAQEYLGKAVNDLMQYFSDDLIDSCCKGVRRGEISGYPHYLGVDIARLGGDESAFEIVEKKKDNIYHIENNTTKYKLTTDTEDRIVEYDKTYNFKKIYIDAGAGSLGVGIFDQLLRKDQTKRKVVPINNRKIVMDRDGKSKQKMMKEDLYDNLKNLMERNKIVCLNDENLRRSFKSVQYEYITKANQQTQMRIFGNYTHIVEGLIRACCCTKEKDINIWVSSIRV